MSEFSSTASHYADLKSQLNPLDSTGYPRAVAYVQLRESILRVVHLSTQPHGQLTPYVTQTTPDAYTAAHTAAVQQALADGEDPPAYIPFPGLALLEYPEPVLPFIAPPNTTPTALTTLQSHHTFALSMVAASVAAFIKQDNAITFLRSCLVHVLPQIVRDGIAPPNEFAIKPLPEILTALDTMFSRLSDNDIASFTTRLTKPFNTADKITIEAHNTNFLTTLSHMRTAGCFPGYQSATRTYFNTFEHGPHASLYATGIEFYNLAHPDAYTPRADRGDHPDRAPLTAERHLTTAMPFMIHVVNGKANSIKPNPYSSARAANELDDPSSDTALAAATTSINLSVTGPPKLIKTLANDLPTDRDQRATSKAATTAASPSNPRNPKKTSAKPSSSGPIPSASTTGKRYCYTCNFGTHGSRDCPLLASGRAHPGHHPACTQFNYSLFPGAAVPTSK